MQLELKLLSTAEVGDSEAVLVQQCGKCRLDTTTWQDLSVSAQTAAGDRACSAVEVSLRVQDTRYWKAVESALVRRPYMFMVQC